MCTVTVYVDAQEIVVTMNRDEQNSRLPEIPPFDWGGMLAPQDSVGRGTWAALRHDGVWACLLNGYSEPLSGVDKNNDVPKTSRGLIIPHIFKHSRPEQAMEQLALSSYASFRLWLGINKEVREYYWDGTHLEIENIVAAPWAFVTSSSWQQPRVQSYRHNAFDRMLETGMRWSNEGIPSIHMYYEIGDETSGVMMQRAQAETKSITQMRIPSSGVPKMHYWPRAALEKGGVEPAPSHTCSFSVRAEGGS